MSDKAKDLFKKAMKVIEENNLFTMKDAYGYIGVPSSTFYDHVPSGSEYSERLKDELAKNRAKTMIGLRRKWYQSDSPTSQIALYKLICDKDEYHRLANTSHEIDQTVKDERLDLSRLSEEELAELEKIYEKAQPSNNA